MSRLPPLPGAGDAPPTEASLPRFHPREGRDQAVLEASRAVVALFLAARSSAFSVKELAEHAGLSERTFYRYFPRKEDAIRPYLGAALDHVLDHVRAAPRDRPLADALVDAHAALLDAARVFHGEAFLPLLDETDRLRAAWLQVLTDAEAGFARVVAERLCIPTDAPQARLAGAVVVTAGRLALQQPGPPEGRRPPSVVFAECMALLGPTLFTPPA